MSFLYTDLQNDLATKLRNKTSSVSPDLRTAINTCVRSELLSLDAKSTIRHTTTYQAVYSDITRYPLPSDMKGEALIDIQKYKNFVDPSYINYEKTTIRNFNTNSDLYTFAFDYSDSLQWLKGRFGASSTTTINTMDSTTDNGTWAASDNATNISTSTLNYISGSGAIGVDMAAAGTTLSITNSTMESVDLTGVNKLFYWVYLPSQADLSLITALGLRYGSSASNYYTSTTTTPFNISSLQQGWNFIAFATGSATGSPDITAIDYLKPYITFSSAPATLTGFIFDNVLGGRGDAMEISYYSFYPWRTSSGTWQENSTDDSDILNASGEEYAVLLARCAKDLSQSIPLSDNDIARFSQEYVSARADYLKRYPSRRKKTTMAY